MKATKSEMQQVHDRVVFHPIKVEQLNKKQKKRSAASADVFETKSMRRNKRPRRRRRTKAKKRIKKFDVTSPTAATESVLVTAAINEIEGRDVAVIETPGAFLTADMDKEVIVILENEMVNAMLETDKEVYRKYVIHGKNKKKHVRSPRQGDVRSAKGSTPILQETVKRFERIRVCQKPIRPLNCNQVDGGRATYRGVAC